MIDSGLLITGAVIYAVVYCTTRWVSAGTIERGTASDLLLPPTMAGILAARLAAAALDDPASLSSLKSLMVIRGGVDFWSGVSAFLVVLAWSARRQRRPLLLTIAELSPFALWAYAAFEATCVLRDGCYGPASPIGLVPEGLHTRMFPIGIAAAIAVAGLGVLVRSLWSWTPRSRVMLAVGGLAAIRAIAAIWLPRLGDDPTRAQLESIAVVALAWLIEVIAAVHARLRHEPTPGAS